MSAGESNLRILVVAPFEPWPLSDGGRLHLYNVLRQLAARADVTLALPLVPQHTNHMPPGLHTVTLTADDNGPAPGADGRLPLTGRWARRHFGWRAEVAGWLRQHAHPGRFDVVMLNGAVYGQYAPLCRLPVVWNPQDELVLATLRDAEGGSWQRRPSALRRAACYALFERYVARRAAATIYVSSLDASYARRWAGAARLEIVQNGVDFDYFQPATEAPTPGTVAFVGSLDFPPNVDAAVFLARRVWPRIHARAPGRRLLIVGRAPPPPIQALASLPGVQVIPNVPDVRPYLRQAAVVVVPTRLGGGLKNKILEACAVGRPVVASPRALAGLSARTGHEVIAADQPDRWVAHVGRLLEDPTAAARLAAQGHAWVRRAHRWSTTGQRFYDILADAAHRRRSPDAPRAPRAPSVAIRHSLSSIPSPAPREELACR